MSASVDNDTVPGQDHAVGRQETWARATITRGQMVDEDQQGSGALVPEVALHGTEIEIGIPLQLFRFEQMRHDHDVDRAQGGIVRGGAPRERVRPSAARITALGVSAKWRAERSLSIAAYCASEPGCSFRK